MIASINLGGTTYDWSHNDIQVVGNTNSIQIPMSNVSWGDVIQVVVLTENGQTITVSATINSTFGFEEDMNGIGFGDDDAMTF